MKTEHKMDYIDIPINRLFNQKITNSDSRGINDLVYAMGAIQAQDYYMMKWAIGTRLPDFTEKMIDTAIDNAEIIRTHLLRPTWHIVSSKDIYWLLELTAPQIKSSLKSRHKGLQLTDEVLKKCFKVIEKALIKSKYLTRDELTRILEKINILNENNRVSHILMLAELDGIICSGILKGKNRTYALLEERVPDKRTLSKAEALAELACRYFTARGPATLQDFIWWSGLSATNAKVALESVKSIFISETINSQNYWFKNSNSFPKYKKDFLALLPAYDEYIISYKDRSACLALVHNTKTIFNNGIFKPTIIFNGRVIGIWKPIKQKENITIEAYPFEPLNKAVKELIEKEAIEYGHFLGKDILVKICQLNK